MEALQSKPARAASVRDMALTAMAGLPSLAGLQLHYQRIPRLRLGAGFGTLPVNSLLNARIPIAPIPMNMSSGGPFNLYPSTQYSLLSWSASALWQPGDGGFFTGVEYSSLGARGSFSGNMKNESTGGISSGAITGDFRFTQPVVSLLAGYRYTAASSGFCLEGAIGVSWLAASQWSLSLGGTASSVAPLDPQADQAFDDAKTDIRRQVTEGMAGVQSLTRFAPLIQLGMGWQFDL